MRAKLLSGEIITLSTDSEEEFKKMYIEQYIDKEKRPWVRVELLLVDDEWCIVVNTYTLLPKIEDMLEIENNWDGLSKNPAAVSFLIQHPEKINWRFFSLNPMAVDILKENLDKICWRSLSCNPGAEDLFRMFPEKVLWGNVAQYHPDARALLDEFTEGFYDKMFLNPNIKPEWVEDLPIWDSGEWPLPDIVARRPAMMPLIKKYYTSLRKRHMAIFHLNANPAAWDWLKERPEDITIHMLVWNTCPEVSKHITKYGHIDIKSWYPAMIEFLKENPDKVVPEDLVYNTRGIDLIEDYVDYITSWGDLVYNEAAGHLIIKYIDRIPFSQDLLQLECIVLKS